MLAMLSHPAVSLSELSSHVTRLKSSDGQLFSHEYESIDPGQQFTWDASNADENKVHAALQFTDSSLWFYYFTV